MNISGRNLTIGMLATLALIVGIVALYVGFTVSDPPETTDTTVTPPITSTDDGDDDTDISVSDATSFCGDGITQGPNSNGVFEACDGESYCNENCNIRTNRSDGVCKIGLVSHHADAIAAQGGYGASIASLNTFVQPLRDNGAQVEVRMIAPGGTNSSTQNSSYADLDLLIAVDENLANVPIGADPGISGNYTTVNQRVNLADMPSAVNLIKSNYESGLHLIITGDHGTGLEGSYEGDVANIFASALTNALGVGITYEQSPYESLYVDRANKSIAPGTYPTGKLAFLNELNVFVQTSPQEQQTLTDGTWSPGRLTVNTGSSFQPACAYTGTFYGGGAPMSASNLTSPTNNGLAITQGSSSCMLAYIPPVDTRGFLFVDSGAGNTVTSGTLDRLFAGMEDCTPEVVVPFCGDGEINQDNEQCDDGNTVDGDGCSSTCQIDPTPYDGLCQVGYTTNDPGLPNRGYTVFKPFQDVASRALGASESFSETGITASNLHGKDILVVTTSTPLEPGPGNTRLFSDAEIAVIQAAFNKGMNIIISAGAGVEPGISDGSKVGRDLLNRMTGIDITLSDQLTSVTETTTRVSGFDSLTNDRPIDTRNLSGYLYSSPTAVQVSGSALCQATVDSTCVFGYQPSDGTKGWVVVDGNGGIPIDGIYPAEGDFFGDKELNYDVGSIQMFFEFTPECQIDGPPDPCVDGLDNDQDGQIDEEDECGIILVSSPTVPLKTQLPQTAIELDNLQLLTIGLFFVMLGALVYSVTDGKLMNAIKLAMPYTNTFEKRVIETVEKEDPPEKKNA